MAQRCDEFGLCSICLNITSLDSYKEVMAKIARRISELLFIDGVLIRVIDRQGEQLEVAASYGLSDEYVSKGPIYLEKSKIDQQTFLKDETVTIYDPGHDSRIQYPEKVQMEQIRAIITAPLKSPSHTYGVIRGYSFKDHRFTEEEIDLFEGLAQQAAVAFETFRTMTRNRKLLEITKQVNSSLDLNTVLQTTVQLAGESMNFKGASIRLFNEYTGKMELRAHWGLSNAFLNWGPYTLKELPIDKEVQQGTIVYIPNVTVDPRFKYAEKAKEEGIVSALCLPLSAKGRVLGTLRIYVSCEYVFPEEEKNFLQILANQAAVAVNNALIYDRQHTLFLVSRSLSGSLKKEEVFKLVVEGATEATNAQGSALVLWSERRNIFTLKAHHGVPDEFLKILRETFMENIGEIKKGKQVIVNKLRCTNDPDNCEREYCALNNVSCKIFEKFGINAVVSIPIRQKEHITGILFCFFAVARDIPEDEIEFFDALASSAGIAIENARIYGTLKKKYTEMVDDVFLWYDGTSKGMDF